jgi:hypothetical protein
MARIFITDLADGLGQLVVRAENGYKKPFLATLISA